MTTTALPSAPTKLPSGPANAGIENAAPEHQPDLGKRQQPEHPPARERRHRSHPEEGTAEEEPDPCDADRGTIVIALNVDEDDDEVHYSNVAFRGEAGELLSEAIEVLVACRNALVRVRRS